MVVLVRPVFVGVIRGVMVIEGKDFILPVISRKHIDGITIVALGQLLEKTEAAGDAVILSAVKIQVQPLGQFEQPLAPFALRDGVEDDADEDDDNQRHEDHGYQGLHDAVLNQSRSPCHYNFKWPLESPGIRFLLSPVSVQRHLCGVELSAAEIRQAVRAALAEDIGIGDATTLATVPETATAGAVMRAREPLVVAGLDFVEAAFRELSPKIKIEKLSRNGQRIVAGKILLKISGPARAILSAERVALNFVQRLSGVATLTAQFVGSVRGTPAQILDTRKTTPGWRRFEKYAVVCGGGKNHRIGLFDMILIKDNHLAALRNEKPNAITAAVARAREKFPKLKVEVEADTLEQVAQAADAGADIILLDNMTTAQLRRAVKIVKGRAKTEASGGVQLKTIHAIAETGVDFISVGTLTHSARAVDIGLDFEE
jgi:nicotinate-nucleotide pyrophosphorylase (carboxylating)